MDAGEGTVPSTVTVDSRLRGNGVGLRGIEESML
jgi:hypothetical protein